MQLYMKPGHKIGKPSPLFTKIEQARLDELKKRYGGSQADTKPAATASFKSIGEAEKAVAAQADKVRAIKAAKADKATIQAEVKLLLGLKEKLADLQASGSESNQSNQSTNTTIPQQIADAEKAITAQGDKVRALKTAKAAKPVVQEQVNILLQLKSQLASLQASAQSNAAPATNSNTVSAKASEEAENAVTVQGDKVRALKAAKADKAAVQAEVAILLDLKKKLTALQSTSQNGISKA